MWDKAQERMLNATLCKHKKYLMCAHKGTFTKEETFPLEWRLPEVRDYISFVCCWIFASYLILITMGRNGAKFLLCTNSFSSPNTPRREGGISSAFHRQGRSDPGGLQRFPAANNCRARMGVNPGRVCL